MVVVVVVVVLRDKPYNIKMHVKFVMSEVLLFLSFS